MLAPEAADGCKFDVRLFGFRQLAAHIVLLELLPSQNPVVLLKHFDS